MPRYSRLSPLGVSGRFVGVIAAATGTMACGGTLTGVSSDTQAAGSISVTSTFTGAGASIATSTGSILARWLDTGGVGASIVESTGTIAGQAQFVGSSGGQLGRLSALGVTGRFYSPVPKALSVPRLWNVSETFGLSVAISDFTDRTFFLVDTFGLNLAPTVAFTGAVGALAAASTWSGVSLATAAVTGSVAATSTWSGVGQNVIVNSGDGSIAVSVDFAGQGSTAGTVFGVGVGSLPVTVTVSGIGRSTASVDAVLSSVAAFTGVGESVFTSIGALSATSNWSGDSTVYVPSTGALSSSSTFTGVSLVRASSDGLLEVHVAFNGAGDSDLPPEVVEARFELLAPSMEFELVAPGIKLKAAA
jgi:hypothetical protein